MKGYTKTELEAERPNISLTEGLDFCLRQLYKDKKHRVTDEIVNCLTFEELLGVLLLARDISGELETLREEKEMLEV